MIGRSVRWWLILGSALTVAVVLALSGLGLGLLFERHLARVEYDNLHDRALAVATMVDAGLDSAPGFHPRVLDPVYQRPYSGEYWQASLGGEVWRSRSLWDEDLLAPAGTAPPGTLRRLALTGPRGEALLAVEMWLEAGTGVFARPLRIVVARSREKLVAARRGFQADLLPALALLGLVLVGASAVQIALGLRPLGQVRARVAALRAGRRPRIGTDLPREVMPLADEIDQLLDARDGELARARTRAADLAHAFKTPLQALMGDAARLREQGDGAMADSVERVTALMRRLVDRELARARMRGAGAGATSDPAQVARRVVAVIRRTPAGAALTWQVEAAPGPAARIDTGDLTEALGALIENAAAHAARGVVVAIAAAGDEVTITVRDDGPGVAEEDLARIGRRGVRLDQMSDGHGMGLAIVAEIAEAAGGRLVLENAGPGLRARLHLPAA